MFSVSKVTHLKSCKSDHIPLFLELRHIALKRNYHLFQFEELWMQHEECEEVIRLA